MPVLPACCITVRGCEAAGLNTISTLELSTNPAAQMGPSLVTAQKPSVSKLNHLKIVQVCVQDTVPNPIK